MRAPPTDGLRHDVQCRSSSSAATTGDDSRGEEKEEGEGGELELASIHDHIDELRTISLEDVRNFCIIAHVVSSPRRPHVC